MPNIVAAVVPPPIDVTDPERESEEGHGPALVAILEDVAMELVVKSSALVLGDQQIESSVPVSRVEAIGEEIELAVPISEPTSSEAEIPFLEVPSTEPDLIVKEPPS